MVECFNSAVFNQSSCISDDTTGGTADVRVDFEDFLDRFWDNKSGVESPFYCQNNSFYAFDTDSWWAELHVDGFTLIA